ncbi:MAG: hypothetical protein P8182_14590 [Deltaproteobacteria bacterium]
MANPSGNLSNIALLLLFFLLATFALVALPETLCARLPLGRCGLLFYLAGGTLIFWLYARRSRQRQTTDAGEEQAKGEAEEQTAAEEGEAQSNVEEVRERIRVRKGRKRDGD